MREGGEVRLVCCPKCENLLQEVTDYSVYQCGGCGAVLRASEKRVDSDMFSEKSEEERVEIMKEGLSVKRDYVNTSDRRMMGLNDGYESDRMSKISTSSRSERKVFRGRPETYRSSLMNREEMWDRRGDMVRGMASHELQDEVEQEFDNMSLYSDNENRRERFRRERIDRAVNGRNGEGYLRPQRLAVDNMRYPVSLYSEDSVYSNHLPRPSGGYDFQMSKFGRMRDQLSESGNSSDKGKGKAFLDGRMANQDSYSSLENWHPERYMATRSPPPQYSVPDTQFSGPSYRKKYYDNSHLTYRQELGDNGFPHPRHPSSRIQEYGDPSKLHMLRSGPIQAPAPFMKSPPHPYVSEPYRDDGMGYFDPRESYNPGVNQHHPACSCFQCYNLRQVPPNVQPTLFSDRFSVVSADGMYNHRENPVSFDSRDYYTRTSNAPPLQTHSSLSDTKWSSDVSSVVDGFVPQKPLRVALDYVGLHCYPLAGGSPFILCCNCFELLLLPKCVSTISVSRKKVKCGACCTIVVFAFSGKKLVLFPDVEVADATVNVDGYGNQSQAKGGTVNLDRVTSDDDDDDDYDNIGCDFQSMDKLEQPSSVNGTANNVSETRRAYSQSTHTIDMEVGTESSTESDSESSRESDLESVNVPREDCKIADPEEKMRLSPPPAGSSLHEYFEYSNKFHAVNHQKEQTKNGNSKHVKSFPNKSAATQVLLNDSASATETDMSSNDFTATGTSFDSGDTSRRNRRAESFFAGIIKKSFKELSKSNQQHVGQEKANVTVNGHLIPEEMIKKAEKVAGPISPGNYWYDYGAGFWGALRGPCLGIIPPYIEEFNYPMPDKCAGGNTDIFVNGRELNQKDMNLLKRRGLPGDRNRSYGVEISGRIIDKETGKELKSLGKLAPTVERVQRGFGMRVPKKDR